MLGQNLSSKVISNLLSCQNDPKQLLDCFLEHSFTSRDLAKSNLEVAASHPYSRHLLHTSAECEVMIARWNPGTPCLPHNHGHSAGWVFYLEGDFEETSYRWEKGQLQAFRVESFLAGTFAKVDVTGVHSCVTQSGGVSLHIYFPRIVAMQVFDTEKKRTLLVSDDCGAWIPEPTQCIEEKKWNLA